MRRRSSGRPGGTRRCRLPRSRTRPPRRARADLRRRARRHGDQAAGAGRVEVVELVAGAVLDRARLIPAAHAKVASGRVVRVRRPEVVRDRAGEGDRPLRVVDRHLAQHARLLVQLIVVVEDLDPVARRDAQHVVLADGREAQHGRRDHLDDGDRDRAVVARPLERRGARRAAVVDLDAVRLVLEAAVAALGRQLARIVVGARRRSFRSSAGPRTARSCRATSESRRRRLAGRVAGVRQQAHLPHGLRARGRVDADRDLHEVRISSAVTSRCQTSR